ncbi:uncharacterized protein LOC114520824 [Dendronephthya gigantea]|uniref:uncharacterized protein LOC114520824 n=1 Tax=Dendronephthya gigantea TaxID=151771 RepID=UPI00106C08F9|nr:uncharacterized protein LOC114520824 [Dendronephthya gigantea]
MTSGRALIVPERQKPLKQLVGMAWVRRGNSNNTYRGALYFTAFTTTLFNSSAWTCSRCGRGVEKALFVVIFLTLSFIAILAVFARSGIDTWIQFSLYIVPILTMICGHRIFKSYSFKEILNRSIEVNPTRNLHGSDGESVRAYESDRFDMRTRRTDFLRNRSLKTCFYPVSLVVYQWTVYLLFYYVVGSDEFSGPFKTPIRPFNIVKYLHLWLGQKIWLPLYYIFWTIAMYVTGFVACCFMLVVDIHKLDIKSFLCKLGDGPLVQSTSNHANEEHRATRVTVHGQYDAVGARVKNPFGFCFKVVSVIAGFLTLGLVDASKTQQLSPGISGLEGTENSEDLVGAVPDSGVSEGLAGSLRFEDGVRATSDGETGSPVNIITARKASRLLIELMSNLEKNSSLFKPFLVLLTFFSVTNLVTHVVAIAVLKIYGFTDLHWWTLARTLFWFLLAIRLLWTVATITNALSRIIPHVCYLRSVGKLPGAKQDWDDFFRLAETFQFGSKSYGFPLTLSQVASIVAVVNFSFLIALSLISKTRS